MKSSKLSFKNPQAFNTINLSPTNNSKSKQTFSFCKSSRFISGPTICPIASYGGQSIRAKNRGTSIGYGKKSDFTQVLTSSPGSSKYNLKSVFETSLNYKKGYKMGEGRDKIKYQSYIDRQLCKTPSSNRYKIDLQTKPKSPVYTLRSRTKLHNKTMTIEPQNNNPGPADYQNPEIITSQSRKSIGRFPELSYKISKSPRFSNPDNKIPGPSAYSDISNFSSAGKYIVSSYKGGTNAKFDKNRRKTKFDEIAKRSIQLPGPGSYKAPSEFGQYDGDIYQSFKKLKVT